MGSSGQKPRPHFRPGISMHSFQLTNAVRSNTSSQEILFLNAGYPPAICMAKLSLFLLYLRLFSVDHTTRRLIYLGIATTCLFYFASILVGIIACIPWKGETRLAALASPRCARAKFLGYVSSFFNVVSDLYLLVIPMNIVRKLQMPGRKKLGLIVLFMFGFL